MPVRSRNTQSQSTRDAISASIAPPALLDSPIKGLTALVSTRSDQGGDLFHHVTHSAARLNSVVEAGQGSQTLKILQGFSAYPELLEVVDLFDMTLSPPLHDT